MNPVESHMYDLGRQARQAGYPIESCNLSKADYKRSWWVAGFYDEDMEMQAKSECDKKANCAA
jgi:hypothetical protein